jgi:aspartyl-tRNA(Asn)/glutamyl-tRNA(Gln) amidotransferase subunit C
MALSVSEVEHIASLARLRLSDEEKALYREQLSAILDYMALLRQVDTSAIEPTASVLPLRGVMRADQPRPSLPPDELLANAPRSEGHLFQVPPVLD